jgi:hypothetical protein
MCGLQPARISVGKHQSFNREKTDLTATEIVGPLRNPSPPRQRTLTSREIEHLRESLREIPEVHLHLSPLHELVCARRESENHFGDAESFHLHTSPGLSGTL